MWMKNRSVHSSLQRWYGNFSTVSRIKPALPQIEKFKEGTELEGFIIKRVEPIPEFNLRAIALQHIKTSARHLHLERNDDNNAFSVGFRTTPFDSTGVPHILEHTVLCGSQKYPCRDPFFKMLTRSLATFLNAMTGPDYTIYPFSTQNKTDYFNLMSVYLDAVFKPILRETDFSQEGWRLEHENVEDRSSPIILKGVVYNEMKGLVSDKSYIFGMNLLNNLLPSHTYGVKSGGDPLDIPKLTYQNFKQFYKDYYHPSNSRFCTYGNICLRKQLKFINSNYLSTFDKDERVFNLTKVPVEPRWTEARRLHVDCNADPMAPIPEKQSWICVSHLCNDIRDSHETFTMQVLSQLLVSGPNTPFYKALVEPNIGGGFVPTTGFDSDTRDTIFSVGLQSVSQDDFDNVLSIYTETVDKVIEEGFDEKQIEAVLHNIELGIKHQSTDFGLKMIMGLSCLWNHDGDVIQAMKITDHLARFKEEISNNPRYLQDVVKKYLKDNKHSLTLTMSPVDNLDKQLEIKEAEVKEEKVRGLGESMREQVYQAGLQLAKEQERGARDPGDCLPSLGVADLVPELARSPLLPAPGLPLTACPLPTNGLTYLRAVLTSPVPPHLKHLLPLFCSVVTKMGTLSHHYREFDQLVRLKTGGISLGTHIVEDIYNPFHFEEGIVLSSYCLDRNIGEMIKLLQELVTEYTLNDLDRFQTLVKTSVANLSNGVGYSGHSYALSAAAAQLSTSALTREQWGGMTYIERVKEVAQKEAWEETLAQLKEVGRRVLSKEYLRLFVNGCPDACEATSKAVSSLVDSLNYTFSSPSKKTDGSVSTGESTGIHYVLKFPINHTAMVVPTVPYKDDLFPALRVLSALLSFKYLLPRIREKGGAYGSSASISSDGLFSFNSYRDPNPLNSFGVFDDASSWVLSGEFSDRDVEEAKLRVFQSVDAPTAPSNRGIRQFLLGVSDEALQEHRLRLMKVDRNQILRGAALLENHTRARALLGPALALPPSQNWIVNEFL